MNEPLPPRRRSSSAASSRRSATVGVIGLGYVGLPLAVEFAKAGFHAIGFDVDAARVAGVNAGRSYVGDVTDAELEPLVKAGRLRAAVPGDEIGTCDAISICVPTPLRKTKDPDISYIVAATREVVAADPSRAAHRAREHDLPGHDDRGPAARARARAA